MKVGIALKLVMRKWQVTNYRLSQVSGVVETTVGKLVNGEMQTTSWDNVEKLAAGFEKIDPLANGAFLKALQIPDGRYANLDRAIDMFWDRELPESIAAVMAVLDECEFLDRENIKKFKALLAKKGAEVDAIMPTDIEDFIGSRMVEKRRKQRGEGQDA